MSETHQVNSPSMETSSTTTTPLFPSRLRRQLLSNISNCQICNSKPFLISKKHHLCYDCFVGSLTSAKVFTQGFEIRPRKENQICIICLNHSKYIGEKFLVCMDCLIRRLGDLGILRYKICNDFQPVFLALDNTLSDSMDPVEWQKKKYYPCDICRKDEIDDHRQERVCFDCIIDMALETPYFSKKSRRVYRI